MSRRNNSRCHGVYQVEQAGRGLSTLDRRTWQARFLRDTKAAIAQDKGFSSWSEVPRLLGLLIERACYKALMCQMIEGLDPEQLTPTLREDYHKFSAGLLRYAAQIGTDRLARDVSPSLGQIREAFTTTETETDERGE